MALVLFHELVVVDERQRERNRCTEASAVDLVEERNLEEDHIANDDCHGNVKCSEGILHPISLFGGGRVLVKDPALDQVDCRGQLQWIGEE